MKKKIQWLKWFDPLRWQESKSPEDSGEQSTLDSFEPEGEEDEARHVRMMAGPYGLIPMGEHGLSSKLYKLWVAHTNFDITPSVAKTVAHVEGVEILRIWTRYRMWVGVANLFDTHEVQRAVERELCGEPEKPVSRPVSQRQEAALRMLEEKLVRDYDGMEWVIYTDADGSLLYSIGEDRTILMRGISEKGLESNVLSKSW